MEPLADRLNSNDSMKEFTRGGSESRVYEANTPGQHTKTPLVSFKKKYLISPSVLVTIFIAMTKYLAKKTLRNERFTWLRIERYSPPYRE